MMLQHPTFESVDAVALLVHWVKQHMAVYGTPHLGDYRTNFDLDLAYDENGGTPRLPAGQSLVGWEGGYFIQLTRSGGQMQSPVERVEVQFDCYGEDADEAFDAARLARAAASSAPNRVPGCVGASELVAPLWLPDSPDAISLPRYILDWTFTFRSRF
jgi:hypothetical protein